MGWPGIYVLKNSINNKEYVGQSISVDDRINYHKRSSIRCPRQSIDFAIRKYGFDNFDINRYYVPIDLLDSFETELIARLKSIAPNGYNLDSGGNQYKVVSLKTRSLMSNNRKGRVISDSTKKKLSLAHSGENGYWYGKKRSAGTKAKISKRLSGQPLTTSTREKMSLAAKKRWSKDGV